MIKKQAKSLPQMIKKQTKPLFYMMKKQAKPLLYMIKKQAKQLLYIIKKLAKPLPKMMVGPISKIVAKYDRCIEIPQAKSLLNMIKTKENHRLI